MNDYELNRKLMSLTGYDESWMERNPQNATDYVNSWDLTMPIAIEYGLDIELPDSRLGGMGTITYYVEKGTDIQVDFSISSNPLRAIVKCLINVMESIEHE